jgi:hypothetical protein
MLRLCNTRVLQILHSMVNSQFLPPLTCDLTETYYIRPRDLLFKSRKIS